MPHLSEAGGFGELTGNKIKVTLITPGQGSSGFYPPETLAEAAGLFVPGTHMYLDHASESERWERPEGSLKNLVGVLETGATLTNEGGLEATATIFPQYREFIQAAAPYIGLSISGAGDLEEINGIPTITKLHAIESVDFVTKAGRGGKVTEILESARKTVIKEGNDMTVTISEAVHKQLTEDAAKAAELQKKVDDLTKQVEDAQAQLDSAKEELKAEQAKTQAAESQARLATVEGIVNEAFQGINAPKGKARMIEAGVNRETFDAESFTKEVREAAAEYDTTPAKGLGGINESVTLDDIRNELKGL